MRRPPELRVADTPIIADSPPGAQGAFSSIMAFEKDALEAARPSTLR